MNVKRRSTITASLACFTLLVATATVGAATISGTAGNDTLRGGAAADKLTGKAGNDKLFGRGGNDVLAGGGGNDLLVGGPGADKLACGAGQDVAKGDAKDKISGDCEVVKGVPAAEPPSTEPPPVASPPPPPAPKAQPGIYCGNTVQGPPLCITTNPDATALVSLRTSSLLDCTDPVQFRFEFTIGFTGTLAVQPSDLSFNLEYSGPLTSGSSQITNMQTTYFIRGKFTTDGKATGQLAVTSLSFDYAGYHFNCTQNPVDWSVNRQG